MKWVWDGAPLPDSYPSFIIFFPIIIPNPGRGGVDVPYSHLPKKMIIPSPSQLCF